MCIVFLLSICKEEFLSLDMICQLEKLSSLHITPFLCEKEALYVHVNTLGEK